MLVAEARYFQSVSLKEMDPISLTCNNCGGDASRTRRGTYWKRSRICTSEVEDMVLDLEYELQMTRN
jgi:hypothetical protein